MVDGRVEFSRGLHQHVAVLEVLVEDPKYLVVEFLVGADASHHCPE